jgi:ribosome-associated protein
VLDLREISTFTEFFVVCSGTSEPHLKAIANQIQDELRTQNEVKPFAVDGFPSSQWLILDYGSVLVHIFHKDRRQYYGLEELWNDAPRVKWEDDKK